MIIIHSLILVGLGKASKNLMRVRHQALKLTVSKVAVRQGANGVGFCHNNPFHKYDKTSIACGDKSLARLL